MTRAALVLLLVAACSSGAKRVGKQPSWRGGAASKQVARVTFAPASLPAVRYNEPLQAPPKSALGDAVVAAVRDAAITAKLPMPAADARLFRACAELAQVVPEDGVIGYSVVEFAMQRNGIIEPSPYLLIVWDDISNLATIVEQLKPRFSEILADGATARVGVGAAKRKSDGTGAIVFALQASGVSTTPIPRSVAAGGAFAIDAVVDTRYRDPELFVTRDNGNTERLPINVGKQGAFKAEVACGKNTGKQQVEITASDASGSTVLANFPVWCGVDPPLTITIEPTHDDDVVVSAEEAEKRLLALMNRDRQAAGLAPLMWDDRVTAVSRAHSEDMRKTKTVAHISPTTGSAADRTRAAGIKTAVVLENVARAYGVGEAHAGLMNSPGHRANVLASAATHVGIGVILGDEVSGRREMFLTQVFIRIPPKVEPAQAADIVRQRINTVRPVIVNAKLQAIAQELAEGLAVGKTRDSLWPGARKKLDAMNTAYSRVGSVVSAVAEMESIDGPSLVGDYKPDDIGVGIAQGNHPDIGEGAIWIVVLMAERLPAKKTR
ncbi:MAG TPA: CAP domain-containing protein [Kofleriaceae bacterium]